MKFLKYNLWRTTEKYLVFLVNWNKECQSLAIQCNNLFYGLYKWFSQNQLVPVHYLSGLNVLMRMQSRIFTIYKYFCDIHNVKKENKFYKKSRMIWTATAANSDRRHVFKGRIAWDCFLNDSNQSRMLMEDCLKVLTNEKRGGLTVVAFDRSPFKLFTLKFSSKSVQAPSYERPETTQRNIFLSFEINNCLPITA